MSVSACVCVRLASRNYVHAAGSPCPPSTISGNDVKTIACEPVHDSCQGGGFCSGARDAVKHALTDVVKRADPIGGHASGALHPTIGHGSGTLQACVRSAWAQARVRDEIVDGRTMFDAAFPDPSNDHQRTTIIQ